MISFTIWSVMVVIAHGILCGGNVSETAQMSCVTSVWAFSAYSVWGTWDVIKFILNKWNTIFALVETDSLRSNSACHLERRASRNLLEIPSRKQEWQASLNEMRTTPQATSSITNDDGLRRKTSPGPWPGVSWDRTEVTGCLGEVVWEGQ